MQKSENAFRYRGTNVEKNLKDFKAILESRIKGASRIFIVPHLNIDLDAIGSASGMAEICSCFKKETFIIVDDAPSNMNVGVRNIFDASAERYQMISSVELEKYRQEDDILITVDVSKKDLIPSKVEVSLSSFSKILVLDHHKSDEHSIESADSHIDIETSSTCEMITRLMKLFGISIDKWLAKALLAGIFLDTNKLKKNTDEKTLEIAARLIRRGATIQDVNDLFVEDFENDRKVQHLIDGAEFVPYHIHNVAVIYNHEHPDTLYTQAELAEAADYLLPYKVDAAYAIGVIGPDQIGISARTTGGMKIVDVMHVFGGGGNEHSAAAKILETSDVFLIREQLLKLLRQEDFYFVKSTALVEEVENQQRAENSTSDAVVITPVEGILVKEKKFLAG